MPGLNETGSFGDVMSWPIIGLHVVLTPDGKILTFGTDINGQQSGEMWYDIWDPATNTHTTLVHATHTDIFCSVAIILPETGEILIAGGDARPLGTVNGGVADVNVFSYLDSTLVPSATGPMEFARWYPTMLTLPTGQLAILGGLDVNKDYTGYSEVYTPGMGWHTLSGAYIAEFDTIANYPRSWVASDGHIVTFSADFGFSHVYSIDPSGSGSVKEIGQLPFPTAFDLPSVMFAQDKALIIGDDGSAWVMDFSDGTVAFTRTGDVGTARKWSSMLVLPNGEVLLTGGSEVYNELVGVNYNAAIWHPDTGIWSVGDAAAVPRLYHSDDILLPDGRVLTQAGGGLIGAPIDNLNAEIYTPGYLYDASGNLAVRPVIEDAPTEIKPGKSFAITVDHPETIQHIAILTFDAATHAFNMADRRLELTFTHNQDGTLQVALPDNVNVLTPGYWMLFAINANGTPSVAATLHVAPQEAHYMPTVEHLALGAGDGMELKTNGIAIYDGFGDFYQLTPDARIAAGSVMSSERVDLKHNFDFSFEINVGANDGGADGMAFVLHNAPEGMAALGNSGGSLGALGIQNGIGIEFDVFQNVPGPTEIANDHTNFFDTDVLAGDPAVGNPFDLGNIEDGNWHKVHVTWNGTALSYTIDGALAGTLTENIVTKYLGGSDFAYFGFTGGTGGLTDVQQLRIDALNTQLENGTAIDVNRADLPVAPTFVVIGDAVHETIANDYALTPDAGFKTGSMMTTQRVDLHKAFSMSFDLNMGANDGGGDGMAFVVHNAPGGANAIGFGGGALGALGIQNGLGIEFDTYQNAGTRDIANDHTNFFDTDNLAIDPAIGAVHDLGNIEDGNWHRVRVEWDGAALKYWVDGVAEGTLTQDISAAFLGGSQFAYLGFTGATGGVTEQQRVRIGTFDATAEDGTDLHQIVQNVVPVTTDDVYQVPVGGVLTVDAAHGVIANDSDANGDELLICSDSRIHTHDQLLAPSHGTLVMNVDGSFTYTANAGYVGIDTFIYCVEDEYACVQGNVTINVTANGNHAPVITSNGGGQTAAVTIAENKTAVTTVTATDQDAADPRTYSISGGADKAKFAINGATGALTFITAPNYETPTDAGGNNCYDVTVQVADGKGGVDTQDIAVTISNVGGVTIVGNASANTVNATTTVAGQPRPTGEEDNISGLAGNDTLSGLGGKDTLSGGVGFDSLDGGAGIDRMIGGSANDTYVVDNSADISDETNGLGGDAGGFDLVLASATYTIGAFVENLTLTGTAKIGGTGNTLANKIAGNTGANLLSGMDGNDTLLGGGGNDSMLGGVGNDSLDGGAGNDSMAGGVGNDTYVIDSSTDIASESDGLGNDAGGTDIVNTGASFTIGAFIENLTLTGTGGIAGTGNALANRLTGNAGDNLLSGLDGNDTIIGGAGNDTVQGGAGNDSIDGGLGADSMAGGAGNDTYILDDAGDIIQEGAGQGIDLVRTALTSVSLANFANVDKLLYTGTGNFTGTGNGIANTVTGGIGNDSLSGAGGGDSLAGAAGNDTLDGGVGNDTMDGGVGNDTMDGGVGNDTMDGGVGNDIFHFSAGSGTDTIKGFDADPTGGQDLIDLHDFGISAANFAAHVTIQVIGADTHVKVDAVNEIIMTGVNGVGVNAITVQDFLLL